jgi:hypothetical protein
MLQRLKIVSKPPLGLPGLALALLVFFAVPWLGVSCSGVEVATQNGYQVMVGSATVNSVESEQKVLFEERARRTGGSNLHAAWWLWFVVLGVGGAGYAGFRLAQGDEKAAKVAAASSGLAAVVLSLSLIVGLPLESKISDFNTAIASRMHAQSAPLVKGIGTAMPAMPVFGADTMNASSERFAGLWFSLVTVWLLVGLSAFFFRTEAAALLGQTAKARAPGPAPAPAQALPHLPPLELPVRPPSSDAPSSGTPPRSNT